MADDDRRAVGSGLVAGAVGRAVVDDDGLEAAVARHLVEDAADLAGLVERGHDDGDERLGQGSCGHGCPVWHPGAYGQPADGTGAAVTRLRVASACVTHVRVLRIAIPGLAIGLVVAIQIVYFNRGFIPGDAFTYLAAGSG